jgi:hypothetical protein
MLPMFKGQQIAFDRHGGARTLSHAPLVMKNSIQPEMTSGDIRCSIGLTYTVCYCAICCCCPVHCEGVTTEALIDPIAGSGERLVGITRPRHHCMERNAHDLASVPRPSVSSTKHLGHKAMKVETVSSLLAVPLTH